MKKKYSMLGLTSFILGVFFLLNSKLNITGAAARTLNIPHTFSFIFGMILILVSVLLFIGSKNLESIIRNVAEIKKNRDLFVEHHYIAYKEYLEKKGEIPKALNEKEKFEFARKKLTDLTEPLIEYNDKRAIEFSEYFGSTPERNSLIDEGKQMKTKVYFSITDPLLKKITENVSNNNKLWEAANKKVYHLTETGSIGSFGKSYKYVPHTDNKYLYLRDIFSGARVFLRKLKNNEYDIIGICAGTQKKEEETKMIERIQEIYQSELGK